MIKLLMGAILLATTVQADPGITVEIKVIIPNVPTGAPVKGEIYARKVR